MIRQDDRTPEQQATHQVLWVGTDSFMSGWGEAQGGTSLAAWACPSGYEYACETYVRSRREMKRVRQVIDRPGERYYPKNAKHLHIYVFKP